MKHRIAKINSARQEENRALFSAVCANGKHADIRISFLGDRIFRFNMAAPGQRNENEICGADNFEGPARLDLRADEDKYVLETDALTLQIWVDPYKLAVLSGDGILLEEHSQDKNVRDEYLNEPLGFLVPGSDDELPKAWTCFRLHENDRFYGLGEKFGALDKRGQQVTIWNRNPFGAGSELAHKNIPFFLSSRGYGFLLNSTVRSRFDFGVNSYFSFSVSVEDEALDYYFISGPTYKDILFSYCRLTGFPSVPPLWSFGIWVSFMGEYMEGREMNQENILSLAAKLREQDIACDVIHLDPFWMEEEDYSSLQWSERISDPEGLITSLGELGLRLCLWEHPYINHTSENFIEAEQNGYLIRNKEGKEYLTNIVYKSPLVKSDYSEDRYNLGGFVDFTNPEAVKWFQEKTRRLLAQGVAAIKTDFGEEIPEDAVFYNGKTGLAVHNLYPRLYNEAVFETLREFSGQAVIWGRSGFVGSQKVPVCWSGDPWSTFESMRQTLKGGLSLALAGFGFWSHDIGGFKGDPGEDLYIRWLQFGLLCSHSRLHGTSTRLPWKISEKALEVYKKFAALRYGWLPYLYSLAQEASDKGLPVIRPMLLEFQDDETCGPLDTQYMLGPYLLVAPVFEESGDVSVYLPAGVWYDYWSGERMEGKVWLRRRFALDQIPLYVRGGAILPSIAQPGDRTTERWDEIQLSIYGGESSRFTISQPGRPGIDIEYDEAGGAVAINSGSTDNVFMVRLRGIGETAENIVTDSGRKLPLERQAGDTDVISITVGKTDTPECRIIFGKENR